MPQLGIALSNHIVTYESLLLDMIKDIIKSERPYEKCINQGAVSLSNAELLAVLLRSGTKGQSALDLAQEILSPKYGNDGLLNIHHLSLEKLQTMKGIGTVKAVQILCLSELAKRLAKASAKEGLILNLPSTVADYYMEEMRHHKQEHMKLLMLNTKSKLLGEKNISKGTVNASLVSPRELFIEALEKDAVSIILVHNHPSGDPTPSTEDINLTNRVKSAGALIGIELLDHIIIGNNCYMSFAEANLL